MSVWSLYERARNIGTKKSPNFVTIWKGRDELGQIHWLVNNKPKNTPDGPIYSVQGGPSSLGSTPTTLKEAIAEYENSQE